MLANKCCDHNFPQIRATKTNLPNFLLNHSCRTKQPEQDIMVFDEEPKPSINHNHKYSALSSSAPAQQHPHNVRIQGTSKSAHYPVEPTPKLSNLFENPVEIDQAEDKTNHQTDIVTSMASLNSIPDATIIPIGIKLRVTVTAANSASDFHVSTTFDL